MKKALVVVIALVTVAAAGAWLAFNYLDLIVKVALEHYGPEVAGVNISVAEVDISPRQGRGAIRGLEIGNPVGFTAPRAARFGEVRVILDPSTVTSDVVRIRELTIVAPRVTYERGPKGTNLSAISRNIERYARGSEESERSGSGKPRSAKRRFVIDRLAIRDANVLMTNPALKGQGIDFSLPTVELRDVGKREGGLTASEVANVVAGAFENRIAQRLLSNIDLLRRGGVEGAIDALKGLLR